MDGSVVETRPAGGPSELAARSVTWAMRLALALGVSVFILRGAEALNARPTLPLFLIVVSECLTALLLLISRRPIVQDMRPWPLIAAVGGSFYFLFIDLGAGTRLLPEWICIGLQLIGIAGAIGAKLSLGRSFDIVAANKGVVEKGAYRFVRHPIYTSYLITHIGYLLSDFSMSNTLLFVVLYSLQASRILNEERVLWSDCRYGTYAERVRWRCVPGLW